jgi:hypothetical protein
MSSSCAPQKEKKNEIPLTNFEQAMRKRPTSRSALRFGHTPEAMLEVFGTVTEARLSCACFVVRLIRFQLATSRSGARECLKSNLTISLPG